MLSGLVLVAGCGGSADAESGQEVSAAEVTPWPLTVDKGALQCHDGAVTVTAGGTEYALNGTAKAKYADLGPVWKDNPKIPGTKVPVTALLERGQKLCG
ncbi:DUF2511 domain-containing protein [Streptomyces sp. NPDC057555]|uniref:DUF2511 domain-containing protein n=1 Tax=Streptomyces sp. NPDC057555 TaxID=3346166 RepID=UPI00369B2FF4